MTAASLASPERIATAADLALRLTQAESALRTLTYGQVDAVIDAEGKPYLLRPAQEELQRGKQKLHAVIEGIADIITLVGRGGVILSQSSAVARVLGYATGELVGRCMFELIHPADLDQVYFAFFNVIGGFKEETRVQFRHFTKDGAHCMLEASVGPVREVSPICVAFSMRVAVAPYQPPVEQDLRKTPMANASAAKEQLLMLSHELRASITPVLISVEEMQKDERFKAKRLLEVVRRNIELQTRLIDALMDFAVLRQLVDPLSPFKAPTDSPSL